MHSSCIKMHGRCMGSGLCNICIAVGSFPGPPEGDGSSGRSAQGRYLAAFCITLHNPGPGCESETSPKSGADTEGRWAVDPLQLWE
jgi:hypothetical protein